MKKKVLLSLIAATAIFTTAIQSFATVIAEGSTTVLPFAQKAAESLMDSNPKIDISIRGGGSGVGINSLISKRCDIAMASRSIKESEKSDAKKNKVSPVVYVIAMDAISIIVHPKNKIDALTKEQIRDIFSGKITNWKELGGADKKIVIVSRDGASGTFETFNELALNGQKLSKNALMQTSNQAVSQIISSSEGAIGYVGLGYVSGRVKAVKVNNIAPSPETVLNKTYPFSRELYFYTDGAAKNEAKEYIDFVLSAAGQKIAASLGFVPVIVKK